MVRLSHPTTMDLVLRKRVCFNVIKRQSITEKIKKKLGHSNIGHSVSVLYEIVSNIPKSSEELEDRESLAVMAATGQDLETGDGDFEGSISVDGRCARHIRPELECAGLGSASGQRHCGSSGSICRSCHLGAMTGLLAGGGAMYLSTLTA